MDMVADIQAQLGQEVSLAIGQSAEFISEKLLVKFLAVEEDSRCPIGVQCISAGEAKCTTSVTLYGKERIITLIQPDRISPTLTSIEGYSFSFNLTPYPQVHKKILDKDYRLFMTIKRV